MQINLSRARYVDHWDPNAISSRSISDPSVWSLTTNAAVWRILSDLPHHPMFDGFSPRSCLPIRMVPNSVPLLLLSNLVGLFDGNLIPVPIFILHRTSVYYLKMNWCVCIKEDIRDTHPRLMIYFTGPTVSRLIEDYVHNDTTLTNMDSPLSSLNSFQLIVCTNKNSRGHRGQWQSSCPPGQNYNPSSLLLL